MHAGGRGVSRAVHIREAALVAQQLGLVVLMLGRDVDFNSYAYTDKKGFLKAGRLANAVDERLTRLGAIGIRPVFDIRCGQCGSIIMLIFASIMKSGSLVRLSSFIFDR